jgi:hypothetical protein
LRARPSVVADAYFSDPTNWLVVFTIYYHSSGEKKSIRHTGSGNYFYGTTQFTSHAQTGIWNKAVLIQGKNGTLFAVSCAEVNEPLTVS